MKSLKEYIHEVSLTEGLLDRVKNKEVSHDAIIKEFLEENYNINGSYTIKEKGNEFIVNVKGNVVVKNENITSLTNEFFEFGLISGDFYCYYCRYLTSLKGAPKEVKGSFDCSECNSLKSLEGAPKEVGGNFYCNECKSLKSLKGAPEKVRWAFDCNNCKSLKSLKGAPKEVGDSFYCVNCGTQFTEDDVKKYTTVAGAILV